MCSHGIYTLKMMLANWQEKRAAGGLELVIVCKYLTRGRGFCSPKGQGQDVVLWLEAQA